MDEKKQPGISFNTVFLKELTFKRTPDLNSSQISINFKSHISFSEDKMQLVYELVCEVEDKKKVFSLSCSMVGVFACINGAENMELSDFSKTNAPALILPYIRELVTTTTIRAGLNPVVFPPINVVSLLGEK
jgi:preprotein translocase subunit SecB